MLATESNPYRPPILDTNCRPFSNTAGRAAILGLVLLGISILATMFLSQFAVSTGSPFGRTLPQSDEYRFFMERLFQPLCRFAIAGLIAGSALIVFGIAGLAWKRFYPDIANPRATDHIDMEKTK